MSYRELWVFLKHLPIDSWTQTALRDRDDLEELRAPADSEQRFGPWALANHQLAALVDEVAWTRFVIARAAKFEKYPEPQPVPRPGRKANAIAPKQSEAAVIYLSKLRATGG